MDHSDKLLAGGNQPGHIIFLNEREFYQDRSQLPSPVALVRKRGLELKIIDQTGVLKAYLPVS
jgi:hypothetical protein